MNCCKWAAGRLLITGLRKDYHISTVLAELHWLPVKSSIEFICGTPSDHFFAKLTTWTTSTKLTSSYLKDKFVWGAPTFECFWNRCMPPYKCCESSLHLPYFDKCCFCEHTISCCKQLTNQMDRGYKFKKIVNGLTFRP